MNGRRFLEGGKLYRFPPEVREEQRALIRELDERYGLTRRITVTTHTKYGDLTEEVKASKSQMRMMNAMREIENRERGGK